MYVKIVLFLVVAALWKENVVLSQQVPIPGMPPSQMWNPYSWMNSFYGPNNNMWSDYYKKAHEIGRQFYKGWDSSGAANMFHTGVTLAHQFADQMQKGVAKYAQDMSSNTRNQGARFPPQSFGF